MRTLEPAHSADGILGPHELAGRRILFALCGFELGGAERQALYLARHLKRLGCDVRVWGHHHRHTGPERVITECEAAGIPWAVHRFRWPCRKTVFLRDAWGLLKALWDERPDVVLAYTTWPCVGIGTVWRMSPAKVFVWGQRTGDGLRGDVVERYAYRHASAVICNAEHEVEYLQRTLGEARAPLHVIRNGYDLGPGQKSRAQWRHELGISEATPVVTMAANFRQRKDHPTLLLAWQRVVPSFPEGARRPKLLLAGAPQETYTSVRQLASTLNLLDSVCFLDHVHDVAGLLSATDIGVLATEYEGTPNAVIEYMASGLPVIASNVPGNREVLGSESEHQYCVPGDPVDLAVRLEHMLNSPELRRSLGERNRKRVVQEFSTQQMCTSTVAVLQSLLVRGHTNTSGSFPVPQNLP